MDDFLLFFADLEVLLSTRGRALLEGGLNFKRPIKCTNNRLIHNQGVPTDEGDEPWRVSGVICSIYLDLEVLSSLEGGLHFDSTH
jgi:hypothetical protein